MEFQLVTMTLIDTLLNSLTFIERKEKREVLDHIKKLITN